MSVETGITIEHIYSRLRSHKIARARHEIMRRLRDAGWIYHEIGARFR